MRGLPWRVETEEIEQFFEGTAWVRDSVRIGELEDGKRTGWGCVLFESEDECANAQAEKDRQHIGNRWVQLYQSSYAQYQSFMEDQQQNKTVDLSTIVNADNISKAVKLTGMPFNASLADVKEFFADFEVSEENIKIEMVRGRKSGNAIVFVNEEDDVQRARDELNKQYIGSRFVFVDIPKLEDYQF
jgi:hypothetical protein